MRITQFLTRVPKPKQNNLVTFTNNFFKTINCSNLEIKQTQNSQSLKISVSSPKLRGIFKTTDNDSFELEEKGSKNLKIYKRLHDKINPVVKPRENIPKNYLNYSDFNKKYLKNPGQSIDKEKTTETIEIEKLKHQICEKNKVICSNERKYILISPKKMWKLQEKNFNIREKEFLSKHIQRFFRKDSINNK